MLLLAAKSRITAALTRVPFRPELTPLNRLLVGCHRLAGGASACDLRTCKSQQRNRLIFKYLCKRGFGKVVLEWKTVLFKDFRVVLFEQ